MRWTASITLAACLGIIAVTSAFGQSTYWLQDSDLKKGETLRETMRHAGARELPVEALALYEAGREAMKSGNKAQAREYFEQATVLDQSFPDAHWALAGLDLFSRPQSVPNHVRAAVMAAFATFSSQHLVITNTLFALL
ncbi:MAG: hypothetical protein HKN21_05340, partial [Candidatus Eisenbacteria bacterium]|nr:hypothetical protein [Candidatus Eisenbacteria bacterium]